MGQYSAIAVLNNELIISYTDVANGDLLVWRDDGSGNGGAGNGQADGTEIRTVDSGGVVGLYTSITTLGNDIAVSYYDQTNGALKQYSPVYPDNPDGGDAGGTGGDGTVGGTSVGGIQRGAGGGSCFIENADAMPWETMPWFLTGIGWIVALGCFACRRR